MSNDKNVSIEELMERINKLESENKELKENVVVGGDWGRKEDCLLELGKSNLRGEWFDGKKWGNKVKINSLNVSSVMSVGKKKYKIEGYIKNSKGLYKIEDFNNWLDGLGECELKRKLVEYRKSLEKKGEEGEEKKIEVEGEEKKVIVRKGKGEEKGEDLKEDKLI